MCFLCYTLIHKQRNGVPSMPIVVVGNVFVDIKGFPESKYIPSGRNSGWVEFVHG